MALVISRVSEDGLGWDRVQMEAHMFHLRAAYGFFCLSSFFFFETCWHLRRQSASYHFHVPMYPSKLLSIQIPQVWYKALHCNKGSYWAGSRVKCAETLSDSPLSRQVLSWGSLGDCPSLWRGVKKCEIHNEGSLQGVNRNDTACACETEPGCAWIRVPPALRTIV